MTTENQNQTVENNEAAAPAVQNNQVATTTVGANYVALLMEESKREFLEVNAGMDLDYVRVGEWLKLNKKGNYVESSDETVSYGDSVDVVVAQGEQRYMLWGADGSPEKGQIITAEKTREEAEEALGSFLAENPEAASRYNNEDIDLRYLAYLVPVKTLSPDETPLIYIFDLPKGDTIGWGKYAKAVFDGKFKTLGIPRKTAVNRIVTRFTSEERKTNDNQSYLGTKFEPVGLFNPSDYGITE
ncbi:hypothetical protein ACF5W4_11265 [Bacillota bacterium Lsc_1132]